MKDNEFKAILSTIIALTIFLCIIAISQSIISYKEVELKSIECKNHK